MRITWTELIQFLKKYYTASQESTFRQFRAGVIYFGLGLGTILSANAYMEPSVHQEFCVLAGLLLGGIGFFLSMMAQTRLIISRFVRFIYK